MPSVESIPFSPVETVTEFLHGVPISDPYRWLEDQESPRTRAWIEVQTRYARAYLDQIPGRERIRTRVRELLDVETLDSPLKAGNRYFFRKRLPGQEQGSIYFRNDAHAEDHDQLLISPLDYGPGPQTAIKPVLVSPDGRWLLYALKAGGERTSRFQLFEIDSRKTCPEILPRGYLRGLAFAPNGLGFYYAHEPLRSAHPFRRAAYHHILGTPFERDCEIFCAGEVQGVRLHLVPGEHALGFLVFHFGKKTTTDFYLWQTGETRPLPIVLNAEYTFHPVLLKDRILALTDRDAPNRRIVEVVVRDSREPRFIDLVPENSFPLRRWNVAQSYFCATYVRDAATHIDLFDFSGASVGSIPAEEGATTRIIWSSPQSDEVFLQRESFLEPPTLFAYSVRSGKRTLLAKNSRRLDSAPFAYVRVTYSSKDDTRIPMFLMGRRNVLEGGPHPTTMTAYGGFGVPVSPRFSVLVAFLAERGCLFALPNIRGGSEFGLSWHEAAKRQKRQNAFDDLLSAAEWLMETGRTTPRQLGLFGGSNAGLLAGVALTQRPDLFGAILCLVPMLDMLRYHLFDDAHVWRDEFGTADDPDEFAALYQYSPYHQIRQGVAYPPTMVVSGDADGNCNPLHARKMIARLQAANCSDSPILLDYNEWRGHSPVLPLRLRIDALTDRLAFLCDQLRVAV
jgi:prolyl oligopeptidase